jgi:hypothetical protein
MEPTQGEFYHEIGESHNSPYTRVIMYLPVSSWKISTFKFPTPHGKFISPFKFGFSLVSTSNVKTVVHYAAKAVYLR